MEVEMKIRGLMMDPSTNLPIVVLKDVNGGAVLPIWVGIYEANAIAQIGSNAQRAINILRAITVGEDLPGVNAHTNPDDSDCIRTVNG